MPPKSEVIICPNPKCNKEIEELILLNDLSKKAAEQYYACPYCLIKVETDAKEDFGRGPQISPSVEESLDLVSDKSKETREEAPAKPSKMEEKGPRECPHHFGYLAKRPKNVSIPQECLTCPKIVQCMLKL